MTLGEYLKQQRVAQRKILKIVARDTEISIGYLHKIETGKQQRPQIWALEKLAAYYGIDQDYIISLAGKIPSDVYWKVTRCPALLEIIRQHPEV